MSDLNIEGFGFELNEQHIDVRNTMLRFGQDRLHPGAAARDASKAFAVEEVNELAGLGGMAMKLQPEDGGPGLDNTAYALSIEALARYDASVAVVAVASNLSASILGKAASADQKARFVEPLATGALGAASFGLTEPGAGSDAAAIKTSARPDGDSWVLDGAKQWITGASDAGLFVVFAKTPTGTDKNAVSCFVLEAGSSGFSVGKPEDKMGLRSSGTAPLFFDNCQLSRDNLIGEVGSGFRLALFGIAASRVAIAAMSIGIAERAFELGLAYARERQAFGQPISQFQNSRFMFADCRTELDKAWLLMLRAARLLDKGIDCRAEAAMAKLAASETCGEVVDRMVQIHGGNGYSREYEVERLYRDARVMRIFEGTSEIQREVIAREVV